MENSKPSAQVPPPIRSNRGCWTCRLRKKKCDEVLPGCLRCASVNVECHYGLRPKWIGNAVLGKEELERIKGIVGASASRKRAAFRAKTRSTTDSASPNTSIQPINSFSHDQSFLYEVGEAIPIGPQGTAPSGNNLESKPLLLRNHPKWVEDHEASLMMHYLDHVFYIQFRFHTPSISAGGRGWLLSLLTRTKPLYHAALSLSAFHQQSLLWFGQEDVQAQTDYLQSLERHHNLTLKELQLFIQAHSENGSPQRIFGANIQILACMVQLISFEV
jgi:hypothetical protein